MTDEKDSNNNHQNTQTQPEHKQPTELISTHHVDPADPGAPFHLHIPSNKLGSPGLLREVFLRPKKTSSSIGSELSDTSEREFRMAYHFSKSPPAQVGRADISLDATQGNSFIQLPQEHIALVESNEGRFELQCNPAGEISGALFQCVARSRHEAVARFEKVVLPFINYVSFSLDVPIFVQAITWHDQKNELTGSLITTPYENIQATSIGGVLWPALAPFHALYREALMSTSAFYRFLCFSKILEGNARWLRPKIFREAKQRKIELPTIKEVIPDHPTLRSFEGDWVGKPIWPLFEERLEKHFRNAIAHFGREGDDPLNVTSLFSDSEIRNYGFLCQLCARTAMQVSEKYLQAIFAHD